MIRQNKISLGDFIDITVDEEEGTFSQSIEVDKNATFILGVVLSSFHPDLPYLRGTFSLKINDEEFFPESTEAMKLMCGIDVPPHQRYYHFKKPVETGNRKVEFKYTDNANTAAAYETYNVRLTIFTELKDEM